MSHIKRISQTGQGEHSAKISNSPCDLHIWSFDLEIVRKIAVSWKIYLIVSYLMKIWSYECDKSLWQTGRRTDGRTDKADRQTVRQTKPPVELLAAPKHASGLPQYSLLYDTYDAERLRRLIGEVNIDCSLVIPSCHQYLSRLVSDKTDRSHDFTNSRDRWLTFSIHSEFRWIYPYCCWTACQISKRYDDSIINLVVPWLTTIYYRIW